MEPADTGQDLGGPLPWRRRLLVVASLVVVAGVAARISLGAEEPQPEPDRQLTGTTTLMPGEPAPTDPEAEKPPEPTGPRSVLPFVTEGALALIVGVMAGLATRTLSKLIIGVILMFFLGVQFLAYKGLITVEWGAFWLFMKDSVLNLTRTEDLATMLKSKVPSVGAFAIGYLLGLKR
ncbi:MAG: FUN14 domain-containing protein [Planctomycetota bacterium]|jgi:uncharacterized membrane protein (Fun14 family)